MQLPRERLLSNQSKQLSEAELLAAILRTGCHVAGAKKNVLSLAAELLWNFKGLSALLAAPPAKLLEIGGIGPAHAAALLATGEIARRMHARVPQLPARVRIEDPHHAATLFRDIANEPQEVLMVCFLTARNDIIEKREIFRGTIRSTTASPREILQVALRNNAAGILVGHNHPSGDPTPSPEDLEFTTQLGRSSTCLGVDFVDHLIVGPGRRFYSMNLGVELSGVPHLAASTVQPRIH